MHFYLLDCFVQITKQNELKQKTNVALRRGVAVASAAAAADGNRATWRIGLKNVGPFGRVGRFRTFWSISGIFEDFGVLKLL